MRKPRSRGASRAELSLLGTLAIVMATLAHAREEAPVMHCQMIQSEELQAIVGDCSRNGVGGPQYCGLWSLTSKHRVFNCYGNSYAGLIPGELRGRPCRLEVVDDQTVALDYPLSDQNPTAVRATYRLVGPNCLEHELVMRDTQPRLHAQGYREVSWCSYMNCPEDTRLHFLSGGQMVAYISPTHGVGSRIAPSCVPEEELEKLVPQDDRRQPFHHDWAPLRFDEPFYYGRLGQMVLIHVFDNPRDLRFFCSPSGGGPSLLPDRTCPAWDFLWIIPEDRYEVGKAYRFRLRLIYKPYVSDADVLAEVRRTQQEMAGSEKG